VAIKFFLFNLSKITGKIRIHGVYDSWEYTGSRVTETSKIDCFSIENSLIDFPYPKIPPRCMPGIYMSDRLVTVRKGALVPASLRQKVKLEKEKPKKYLRKYLKYIGEKGAKMTV
jgi:hypothetical protein